MSTLIARPSDIITDSGTVSLTAGTANSVFPLTNLYDRNAASVFKSTGTSATIQVVYGASKTLQGIALINHNLTGATVTVTNAAGFSKVLAIPAAVEDALTLDPWDDYRGLANTSSTTWTVTITGAATVVAIGELLLIQTLRTIEVYQFPEDVEAHPTNTKVTDYQVRLSYGMGVRARRYELELVNEKQRAGLVSLERDARGGLRHSLFILDSRLNDAMYADILNEERSITRKPPNAMHAELILAECQKGLAL